MQQRNLSATNPFASGSEEHAAYQRAYNLAIAHLYIDYQAICGRVLGFLLQELPWAEGRLVIARKVNSCINEQKLVELGQLYVDHFIRSCEENRQLGTR
jgi:hypothetical protein